MPLGMMVDGDRLHVAACGRTGERLSLVLFDRKTGNTKEIPFPKEGIVGRVQAMQLSGDKLLEPGRFACLLKSGKKEIVDPFARRTIGDERWGHFHPKALIPTDGTATEKSEAWKKDRPLLRPWNEMLLYYMHVRGFTMHKSSKVSAPGTFEGAVEKLPYLKELGINTAEFMPVYDFNEVMPEKKARTTTEAEAAGKKGHIGRRINYWGFTRGNYFTPKNSYSADGNGPESFQKLVLAFHEAGIEVIADFYFEPDMSDEFILQVLRFWTINYHVDGFRILGVAIPSEEILTDPYLSSVKIILEHVPQEIERIAASCEALTASTDDRHSYLRQDKVPNLAVLNDPFLYDIRRYLKSDSDMLRAFQGHLMEHPQRYTVINFLSSYAGFTLNDMVSYDGKHNEANGENNTDGTDYNYSWNCGAEGATRRKPILRLRSRQIKNALVMLLLSQGVPEITAGDEFLHTRHGNNNPYCQDNSVNWLNWEHLEKNREAFDFMKSLIAFRKEHPVFRSAEAKRHTDFRNYGWPDVSFHGEQAWAPRYEDYFRHIGVLYSGSYEIRPDGTPDRDFYLAFNMYWQSKQLAVPKAPVGKQWKEVLATGEPEKSAKKDPEDGSFITVPPRSVRILVTEDVKPSKKQVKKNGKSGKKE
ncbi:glycogen operon protein [Lachnospiraceae bacterium]|nr:glycogen operon protein [Lachnospiraceae bacterium]